MWWTKPNFIFILPPPPKIRRSLLKALPPLSSGTMSTTSSPAASRPARRTASLHSPTANGSKPRPEKLFDQEDEIKLLKTLADRPPSSSPHATVLEGSMGDKFTPSQLSHKIRRLRLKYRKMARSKSAIKTPHDSEVFQISRRIWGKKKEEEEQQQPAEEGFATPEANGRDMVEEVAAATGRVNDLGRFPVLVDECDRSLGIDDGVWREALKGVDEEQLRVMNEKLVLLRCEEAAFLAKKADLVRELTGMILLGMASASQSQNNV
ncbi:hypothetical protein MLD38_003487 [Melastoma candidum]|uniref:Uncharacterized protein n=1 Tax=Melastoma candidum TaxID=119954 RepID=A0ACB9S2R5_9MYRT|nr:hypothetical protein MLD38_003487 [Melastoma candidum]